MRVEAKVSVSYNPFSDVQSEPDTVPNLSHRQKQKIHFKKQIIITIVRNKKSLLLQKMHTGCTDSRGLTQPHIHTKGSIEMYRLANNQPNGSNK